MSRFAREPALLNEKFRQVKSFQALAARAVEDTFPSPSHVQGRLFGDIYGRLRRFGALLKFEPQETVGRERETVRLAFDGREFHIAKHLDGNEALLFGEIEIDRLSETRKIRQAKNLFVFVCPEIRQDFAVGRIEEFDAAAAEDAEKLSKGNHVAHPVQERRGIALLRFDVDRFITPDWIHDHRAVETGWHRRRKSSVPVAVPLHRSANAIAIAEIDVVAHSDFIAVVKNGRSGKRKQ